MLRRALALLSLLALSCDKSAAPPATPSAPTADAAAPDEAKRFVGEVDAKLRTLWVAAETAAWEQATNITPDTKKAAAAAQEQVMEPRVRSHRASCLSGAALGRRR